MPTVRVSIRIPEHQHEIVIADLADHGFDAFEEGEGVLRAFIPAGRWTDDDRERLERILARMGAAAVLEEEILPDVNWNARWEASILPLDMPPFLIKTSWHEIPAQLEDRVVLEIDPKMSFGTGNHASTRLALRFLPNLVAGAESVLDAGCGTGILALAALKLGAAHAIGFDIDPWASANSRENAARNAMSNRYVVREGSVDVVHERDFDLVLANINRHILLELMPAFRERMAQAGALVLAGLLVEDREIVVQEAARAGLYLEKEATEEEWWAATFCIARRPF